MNYASEAFSALIRPITRRSNSQNSTVSSRPRPGDLEEDGFLVVGETSSERTTVRACDFKNDIDQPPAYQHSQKTDSDSNLPSYMDYKNSTPSYQPWGSQLPYAVNPTAASGTSATGHMTSSSMATGNMHVGSYNTIALSQTALTGVPFSLAPHLQNVISVATDRCPNIRMTSVDISKYDYDFDLEMRVLSEHAACN